MTVFADLCRGFDAWRTRHFDNHHKSVTLMLRVAEGFRTYIGAPKSFEELHSGNIKDYVVLLKATDLHDGRVRHEELGDHSPFDVLSMWDDGFYHFGLGLAVEVNPNAWPKQRFPIPMYFIVEDDTCVMHVTSRSEGEFRFPINNMSNLDRMYEFMASIIADIFKTKPWDFAEGKAPIGFIPVK